MKVIINAIKTETEKKPARPLAVRVYLPKINPFDEKDDFLDILGSLLEGFKIRLKLKVFRLF